ncbi:DoxX family protein [Parasphingorhabdus sp.]|uniref:DoxX family protein n=1 Tax=Parasphingorhabdus sp. TaxID=2709688 RepID=UPI003BB08026
MKAAEIVYASGRIGLASLFILGALNKLANYDATGAKMAEVGLVPAAVLLPVTVMLEAVGGLMVAFGIRKAWIAAVALSIFTLATNVYFHRFWALDGNIAALELSLFFKNVAIAGGLIAIAAIEYDRKQEIVSC